MPITSVYPRLDSHLWEMAEMKCDLRMYWHWKRNEILLLWFGLAKPRAAAFLLFNNGEWGLSSSDQVFCYVCFLYSKSRSKWIICSMKQPTLPLQSSTVFKNKDPANWSDLYRDDFLSYHLYYRAKSNFILFHILFLERIFRLKVGKKFRLLPKVKRVFQ